MDLEIIEIGFDGCAFYVLTKNDQIHNLNLPLLKYHKLLAHIKKHQMLDI